MARHTHNTSMELYFTPKSESFISPRTVEERLDRALLHEQRIGHFAVSQVLSEELVAQQELFGTPNDLARAHMKRLSLPLHALATARTKGTHLEKDLLESVNKTYKETGAILHNFINERDELDPGKAQRYRHNQLSGAISELAFSALLLRNRHQHGYFALPSSRFEDHALPDATGKRHATDFTVVNEQNPSQPVAIQLKTGDTHIGPRYAQSVPVISLQGVAGSYYEGKYHLPFALASDSKGEATVDDTARITQASRAVIHQLQKIENTQ